MKWDYHTVISIILGIVFAYGLFSEEVEEVEEPKPKRQPKKRVVPVKKNGRWIDKEID
jgi:hypothetical protein